MAHLELVIQAPPDVHEDFIREVNKWEYEAEGEHRTGVVRPFVSEIKGYDVRIPEEFAAQFLRDIQAKGIQAKRKENVETRGAAIGGNIVSKGIKWIRRFTGLKEVKGVEEKDQKHKLDRSWHYAFFVGKMDDDVRKIETGGKREIL